MKPPVAETAGGATPPTLASLLPAAFIERFIEPLFADQNRAQIAGDLLGAPLAYSCARLCRCPITDMKTLHAYAAAKTIASRRARGRVIDLLGELAEAGVRGVVIKGLALALDVYPVPVQRLSSGIDLLFRESDMPRLGDLLARRGFQSEPDTRASRRTGALVTSPLAPLFHQDIGIRIDVHVVSGKRSAPPGPDLDRVFGAAREIESEAGRCLVPTHEHSFVIAALNGYGREHGPVPLKALFDARLLLGRRGGAMDWREVESLANAGRIVTRLVFLRELLEALGGGHAPVFAGRRPSALLRAQLGAVAATAYRLDLGAWGGARRMMLDAALSDSPAASLGRRMASQATAPRHLAGVPRAQQAFQPTALSIAPASHGQRPAVGTVARIRFSDDEVAARSIDQDTLRRAESAFAADGVVLFENAFSPDLVGELRRHYVARYSPYFLDREYADALAVGDMRTMISLAMERAFNTPDLYANPLVLPVIRQILGRRCILNSFGSVVALPGAPLQHVHTDHPDLFPDDPEEFPGGGLTTPLPCYVVSLFVPLVDLDETTGMTRVYKGSHLASREAAAKMDFQDIPAPIGSCYLMDYRVMHCGTANRSDGLRPILYSLYSRQWFRDHVNYHKQAELMISDGEFARVPDVYRHLFAWTRQGNSGQPFRSNGAVARLARRIGLNKSTSAGR